MSSSDFICSHVQQSSRCCAKCVPTHIKNDTSEGGKCVFLYSGRRNGEFVQLDVACSMKPMKQGHENFSRVVDCFRGEIHHSRESGPPEQAQREVRRPLLIAQSRSPAVPQKSYKAVSNPVLLASQSTRAPTRSRLAQKFDRRFPVAAARTGLQGWLGQPPKTPQER